MDVDDGEPKIERKQEDKPKQEVKNKTEERPKACPYCSVVGESIGTGVYKCVNDKCDNDVFNMDWVYFHEKRREEFLGDVDMVEVRDELQDIIPEIR